jgi:CubicO group peptidase (beta-lactamase class C family)
MIDRRRMLAGIAASTALAAAPARARDRIDPGPTRSFLESLVAAGQIPGAIVGVVTPGRYDPQWIAVGKTRFEDGAAVTPQTIWRIFSMTKPITGIAVMQQVAAGRITLDTPIAEVLPEFRTMRVLVDPAKGLDSRPAEKPILLRHLLTHSAGFTYTIAGDGPLEQAYRKLGLHPMNEGVLANPADPPAPDLKTYMERLATLPLRTEPGTALQYSVSLDVAGALLERLLGKSLDRIFAEAIFAPLGMKDSGFWLSAEQAGRLSSLYLSFDPVKRVPLPRPVEVDSPQKTQWSKRPAMLAGGAGLASSADDFARFAQAMLNDGLFEGRMLLPRHTARQAMANQLPSGLFFPPYQGMASGGIATLHDGSAKPDGTTAGLWGWAGAASTLFQVDPVRQRAVVVMLQTMGLINSPVDPAATRMLNSL